MKISAKGKNDCTTCIVGKQTEYRSRKERSRSDEVFGLVHTDLAGPIKPLGIRGYSYVILFTDDFSGAHFVYFLKHKSDAVIALKQFLADTAPVGHVKALRSDNGGEFINKEFKNTLRENKTKHETCAPYSPHQNGVAERNWRTIFDMARCLLTEANLPKNMWVYAVQTAVYIRNRCFNHRTKQTPYSIVMGKKPDLGNMHTFGSVCYAYQHTHKTKLDPRTKRGIFVGYAKMNPAYLVYYPDMNCVREYRCVKFVDCENEEAQPDLVEESNEVVDDDSSVVTETNDTHVHVEANENERRYPKRNRKTPTYLNDYAHTVNNTVDYCYKVAMGVPLTYKQAINSDESIQWQQAMDSEISSLNANHTWQLAKLPQDRNAIGGKWVYARKLDKDGEVDRFKARYVARGFNQVQGVDYTETFSPTVSITTVRALAQIAVNHDWTIRHLDVKTAYLNAPIDCQIYVEQPEGYQQCDADGEKLYCKLKKSLYGLKQSGRLWNHTLNEFLEEIGLERSKVDHCLYTKNSDNNEHVRLIVFVDDVVLAGDNESVMCIKEKLEQRFKMKDLGDLSWFLGIEFVRDENTLKINQRQYIERLLSKYGMENSKAAPTPCIERPDFEQDSEIEQDIDNETYRSVIGSLMYAALCTRPDIQWVVSQLSRFLNETVTVARWIAVKRILRYLRGTVDYGLVYRKSELKLKGYCDADWAGSENRKSTSGICLSLNDDSDSSLVTWRSQRQSVVALSTCEAEYIALALGFQEGIFLKQLVSDLDYVKNPEELKVTMFSDSQSAISLSENPVYHKRSKHIDIKYHFVRDNIGKGFNLKYIGTKDMLADFLTKPVGKIILKRVCDMIFV